MLRAPACIRTPPCSPCAMGHSTSRSSLYQTSQAQAKGNLSIAGLVSWFAWRSAYLTRLGSIHKRVRECPGANRGCGVIHPQV